MLVAAPVGATALAMLTHFGAVRLLEGGRFAYAKTQRKKKKPLE